MGDGSNEVGTYFSRLCAKMYVILLLLLANRMGEHLSALPFWSGASRVRKQYAPVVVVLIIIIFTVPSGPNHCVGPAAG